MSTINTNQFTITPILGDTSWPGSGLVSTAAVDPNAGSPILAGQAVKILPAANSNGIPVVQALTALTDVTWGIALYNLKSSSFPANAPLSIGQRNTTVNMLSGSAIAAGALVEFHYSDSRVYTNVLANHPPIGRCIDGATSAGQITRVLLDVPNTFNSPS